MEDWVWRGLVFWFIFSVFIVGKDIEGGLGSWFFLDLVFYCFVFYSVKNNYNLFR